MNPRKLPPIPPVKPPLPRDHPYERARRAREHRIKELRAQGETR